MQKIIAFLVAALSENGSPSSSRILSAALSISSMSLIAWCLHHAMRLDKESAMVWVGGMPALIYALAAFAVSPYTVAKLGQTISSFRDKVTAPAAPAPDKSKDTQETTS